MKILITSGGCKVPIDEVRNIGNFSSGRYGAQILYELWIVGGHDIIFFHEKGSSIGGFEGKDLEQGGSVRFIQYKDYWDYLNVKNIIKIEQPDIIISAAAISDFILEKKFEGKISSSDETLTLTLTKGEKVIKSFRELAPKALIVGFKLLVSPSEEEINCAVDKVFDNGADMVVYNDLTELRKGNVARQLYYYKDRGKKGYGIMGSAAELVQEIVEREFLKTIFEK